MQTTAKRELILVQYQCCSVKTASVRLPVLRCNYPNSSTPSIELWGEHEVTQLGTQLLDNIESTEHKNSNNCGSEIQPLSNDSDPLEMQFEELFEKHSLSILRLVPHPFLLWYRKNISVVYEELRFQMPHTTFLSSWSETLNHLNFAIVFRMCLSLTVPS